MSKTRIETAMEIEDILKESGYEFNVMFDPSDGSYYFKLSSIKTDDKNND